MKLPLKSCLKNSFASGPVNLSSVAAVPLPPMAISTAAQPLNVSPSKRFDITTVLLVIIVVGLVFGCILIFLLFRLRRMELQLQQTTKNFNMQTVRELIAQEIQDTVEQLEEQLFIESVPDMEDLPIASSRLHLGTSAPNNEGSMGTGGSPMAIPSFFMPNVQDVQSMLEAMGAIGAVLNLDEMMSAPPTMQHYENRIEEIIEENNIPENIQPSEVCHSESESFTNTATQHVAHSFFDNTEIVQANETVQEVAPEVLQAAMQEVAPKVAPESVPEVLQEAVREVAPEVVPKSVPKVLQAATQEVVVENVKELVQEAMQEVVQEVVQEAVVENVEELVQEAVVENVVENVEELVQEAVVEAVVENVEELVPEAVPETFVDTASIHLLPSKRPKRTPAPRGKRKKNETTDIDINDL